MTRVTAIVALFLSLLTALVITSCGGNSAAMDNLGSQPVIEASAGNDAGPSNKATSEERDYFPYMELVEFFQTNSIANWYAIHSPFESGLPDPTPPFEGTGWSPYQKATAVWNDSDTEKDMNGCLFGYVYW
jgi:hypothetical protein